MPHTTLANPWLLEMVAGMIEEGESVEDVARREAIEEAGLIVKRTKPVLSFLASPGAPVSVRQLWWAKWTPRPQAVFTVWLMKTKIFAFMW